MTAPARITYPSKAQIERMVAAARSAGIDVAGLEVSPDGTIRVVEPRAVSIPTNDFDRYQDRL